MPNPYKIKVKDITNKAEENKNIITDQSRVDINIEENVKLRAPNHSIFKIPRNKTVDWQPMEIIEVLLDGLPDEKDLSNQYKSWEVVLEKFPEDSIPFISVEMIIRQSTIVTQVPKTLREQTLADAGIEWNKSANRWERIAQPGKPYYDPDKNKWTRPIVSGEPVYDADTNIWSNTVKDKVEDNIVQDDGAGSQTLYKTVSFHIEDIEDKGDQNNKFKNVTIVASLWFEEIPFPKREGRYNIKPQEAKLIVEITNPT